MFARAYFGERYFAPRYFGEGTNVVQPQPQPPSGGVRRGRRPDRLLPPRRPIVAEIHTGQGGQVGRAIVTLHVAGSIRSFATAQQTQAAFGLSVASVILAAQAQAANANAWPTMRTTIRSEQPTGASEADAALQLIATVHSGIDDAPSRPTYSGKPLPRIFLQEATPWP